MEDAYAPASVGQPANTASLSDEHSPSAVPDRSHAGPVSPSFNPSPNSHPTLPSPPHITSSNLALSPFQPQAYHLNAPPSVPPPTYLALRPAPTQSSSLIPKFLRTLAFVLALLLGSGALCTWIYSRYILPRWVLSKQARNVLLEEHAHRLTKMQESVEKLKGIGFVKITATVVAPTVDDAPAIEDKDDPKLIQDSDDGSKEQGPSHSSDNSATSTIEYPAPPKASSSSGSLEGPLEPSYPDPPSEYLPLTNLSNISPLLPQLSAPQYLARPTPQTVSQTLRSFSSHLSAQSLLFSSRTTRSSGGVGLASLSSQLEGAGGSGGGAWGGGLGEDEKELIGLVSGLRGDIRGLKGLLISKRAFNPTRAAAAANSGRSFGFGRPSAPVTWSPPPPVAASSHSAS